MPIQDWDLHHWKQQRLSLLKLAGEGGEQYAERDHPGAVFSRRFLPSPAGSPHQIDGGGAVSSSPCSCPNPLSATVMMVLLFGLLRGGVQGGLESPVQGHEAGHLHFDLYRRFEPVLFQRGHYDLPVEVFAYHHWRPSLGLLHGAAGHAAHLGHIPADLYHIAHPADRRLGEPVGAAEETESTRP